MGRWLLTCTAVATASVAVAGCSSTCSANADKLATLQRGMSSQEATAVMGCAAGTISSPDGDGVKRMEWRGPGSLFIATDLDFRDDKLLYYTTRSKLGF